MRLALRSRASDNAGANDTAAAPASTTMIAITTINSMSVKPGENRLFFFFFPVDDVIALRAAFAPVLA